MGFGFSPGNPPPTPGCCRLTLSLAPLMGYFPRINNLSPRFDSSLWEHGLLHRSLGLYLWDNCCRADPLLVRGHPEKMHGNKIWVSQRENSLWWCLELGGSQARGAWAGRASGQQPTVDAGRFLPPILTSFPQMAFFYACGEGQCIFTAEVVLSLPSLAQQFTFCSLLLFLKGSKLVQLGVGGWPRCFDTEVREQTCIIPCDVWPRETPPASSHTKSVLV